MEELNIVTEIRDLTREAAQPQTGEAVHYVVIPEGSKVISLKEQQYPEGMRPSRVIAHPKFQDQASFTSYVNTFKDDRTRVLANADPGALNFLALIDYHGIGAGDVRTPEFVSHRAGLQLKHSEEWMLWNGKNDKLIPQVEFAEFLEDNRSDIIKPDSATMLEIAKDLEAHSEVNFASKIDTRNGAAVLKYDEQIKANVTTGQIEVPESFTIRIPVFFGEAPIEIMARLRFRITEGKLRFQYKLNRPAEVIAKAFDLARKDIALAVSLEVLLGTL